jgi:hypothetical protein
LSPGGDKRAAAEGSKPSAGHESRPQKRRIHQDPPTKNRQIDCAAGGDQEFEENGPFAARGDFAGASRRCDVSRAGGSWNKRAEFMGYQGSHCAAVDLEEKRPWILVDSWWIPGQRITRA